MKIIIRTLHKNRLYTAVNILGLALSLACVILIARYVHQETTVNHFAIDLSRTFMMTVEEENGQVRYSGAADPNKDANYRDPMNHHGIERFSIFIPFEEDYILHEEYRYNTKLIVTDSNFLKVLPYPLLRGRTFTEAPDEAILTHRLAEKIFGDDNPVGKNITFSTGDNLRVVGVLGEPATKSSFDFELLVNINLKEQWGRMTHNLVMLQPGQSVEQVNEVNSQFMSLLGYMSKGVRYQLVPLEEFYTDRSRILYQDTNPVFVQGNANSVKVLSIVALLILVVGLFNFVNIYTVVVLKRAREFGVKKIYGASRWRIALQIWGENFLMVAMAIFIAWLFIEILEVPMASQLAFSVRSNVMFGILLSTAILVLLPLVASLYPFLKYTRSSPIASLRLVNVGGVSVVSRKGFLLLQYTISFGLLIVALFFMKQLHFMLNNEPGYKTENVIISTMMVQNHHFYSSGDDRQSRYQKLTENKEYIKRKMEESPLFTEWLFGSPVYDLNATMLVKRSDREEYIEVAGEWLTPQYYDMFGFQLLEGRLWDSTDVFNQYKCIINEAAKKLFDIDDIHSVKLQPERRMWISSRSDIDSNPPYEIVGVIKDFNTGHLSKSTAPLLLSYSEDRGGVGVWETVLARFVPGSQEEAVAYMEAIYKEINNNADFTYSLLDDEITRLYEEDRKVANVYILFSLLAILISCIGLFALSLFDIRQRYREIALRKVNGATTKDISRLLLKKYARLLALAFAIAVPTALFVIHKYLEGFAHKAPVSWWLFAIAGIVVAGVSLLTLSWQVRKALQVNPAKVLKGE